MIGKNVFVGSDSQIIAPVEIPDEVMIGAGSTVPPNSKIEKGSLAISRSKLKSIPNFFYKFFKK
jgi:bifunctional UDP-N-acetylglucosamine pyrophosphorylase/glucosamine-1-phosphate N-acetyltransferase